MCREWAVLGTLGFGGLKTQGSTQIWGCGLVAIGAGFLWRVNRVWCSDPGARSIQLRTKLNKCVLGIPCTSSALFSGHS